VLVVVLQERAKPAHRCAQRLAIMQQRLIVETGAHHRAHQLRVPAAPAQPRNRPLDLAELDKQRLQPGPGERLPAGAQRQILRAEPQMIFSISGSFLTYCSSCPFFILNSGGWAR